MSKIDFLAEYRRWMDSPALTEEEWAELNSIAGDEKEIENRFYAPLEFGTAGLRGIMKMGLHNMNIHVIRHATQSFAEVILAEGEETVKKGIAIAHDCRNNSKKFAKEAARVMAANGIPVKLFEDLRPTPELSFAVIHYGCAAGLNITASHNPKEYNGYKVYWSDGAQLPPAKADMIAKKMEENDFFLSFKTCDFDEAVRNGMITILGEETDEAFLQHVLNEAIDTECVKKATDNLNIVYTPFHGCGYKLVPEALKRLGISNLFPVPEQMIVDGNFPTVESPNPENPEGFYLAVDLAKKVNSDLIIGTDPDADRIAIMVRGNDGEYSVITGNQLGVLLLDYIITARNSTNSMPENPGAMCSLVSTAMARAIAEKNGIHFEETFTGFKFMAELANKWDEEKSYKYIMAFEESCGYMIGDYVRDKDAVTAAMLVSEMACHYALENKTLKDALEDLYVKYGYFFERTLNLVMPGLDGLEKMKSIMAKLRSDKPTNIDGVGVARVRDYSDGTIYVTGLGPVDKTPFYGSNVLYFELEDGTSFIIRPSGTEPKIKIYILARGESREECNEKLDKYEVFAQSLKEL